MATGMKSGNRVVIASAASRQTILLLATLLLSFILILLVSFVSLQLFPFSGDEYSYIFQSKILASGKLYSPSPPGSEFFELHHVINDGKWYSKYSFGWSLVLSLGELLGMKWLVNPLIGLLTLIILFLFAKLMINGKIALVSVFLTAVSPFFIFNSSSYFPHPVSLLFSVLFLFSYFLAIKKNQAAYALVSGFSLGVVFLIRPVDAFIVGIPVAVHSLLELRNNRKLLKCLIFIAVAASVSLFIQIVLNYVLTGSPLKFPYLLYGPYDKPAFYSGIFALGIKNTISHLLSLLVWLPGLLLLIPFARYDKFKFTLLSIFALDVAFYFFYPFSGGDQFGPRYYYAAIPALAVLGGSAIERLHLVKKWFLITLLIFNLSLGAYFAYVLHGEVQFRSQVYDYATTQGIHNSIIFLKSTEEQGCSWYARNSPKLDDDNLLVCDLGEKNAELMKYYPNRKAYYYTLKDRG